MPTLKPLGPLLNAPDYADRVNLIKKIKIGKRLALCARRSRSQRTAQGQGARQRPGRSPHRRRLLHRVARCRDAASAPPSTREDAIDQARRKAVELRAIRDGSHCRSRAGA